MRSLALIWLCSWLLLGSVGLAAEATPAKETPPAPVGVRVFSAGHSFHMPMVPLLEQIVKNAGIDGHTLAGKQMIGGSTVTQHWNRPDVQNTAKTALKTGKVDVLTLSPHFIIPDAAIDQFTDLLLEHNSAARTLVQMSWLPHHATLELALGYNETDKDKTDLAALRKVTDPLAEKLRVQIRKLNERLAATAKRQVVFLVPTGQALYLLRERVAAGKVPGIPTQSSLFSDTFGHGKPPIGVMNAYCHYAVIYNRTPVGLPVPEVLTKAGFGNDAKEVNRVLQECAWEAVTNEELSGVKK
jgi:hypothetical protein